MAVHHLSRFQIAGMPFVFAPLFEHFNDVDGPGDLRIGWEWYGTISEEDRSDAIAFCRRVEANYQSLGAAKAALAAAKTRAAAEAEAR